MRFNHLLKIGLLVLVICMMLFGCASAVIAGDIDNQWQESMSPYRKSIRIKKIDLTFYDKGQGEPVLLIHGYSLSSYSCRNNVESLVNAGYRVILIDLPGHGKSRIPDESFSYSIENLAALVIAFTKRLELGKFNIMGHSLGSVLTLYITSNYPEHILRSIVINSPAYGPPQRLLLTYPGMTTIATLFFGEWTIKASVEKMYYNADLLSQDSIYEYALPAKKEGYWKMLSRLSNDFFSPEFDKLITRYSDINKSLLIVFGNEDNWIPPEYPAKLNDEIKRSKRLTIQSCGHNPHEECADLFNRGLVSFLKSPP